MRNSKGQFIKGFGFWLGKKHPQKSNTLIEIKCGKCDKLFKAFKANNRKYCSKGCAGVFRMKGKNNPCWKGGITKLSLTIRKSLKYRQWRSDIFTRDNFTCQECDVVGRIQAHHIKSFAEIMYEYNIKTQEEGIDCEELWNINNGVTLCRECHELTDNYGGI